MDPIVIPITFAGLLLVAGVVGHFLALREQRRQQHDSK
jgi:hypothetical protein